MTNANGNGSHIGHQIMAMMDRLGVSPLPRNYQLFYACIANSDQKLRIAMRALGNAPAQADLDGLIDKFMPEAYGSSHMRRQQENVLRNLDMVLSQLNLDQSELVSYTGAVDKVSESLSAQDAAGKLTHEMITQVAGAIVEAGRRKVAAGNRTISSVGGKVDELAKLRDEIDRLRLLANTDELTRIFNRRAFDETLSNHFSKEDRTTLALVVLDIDHFKKINDTYGHAGGDRVLKMVADCLKSSMRQDAFVARTGGEEFAIVLRKTGLQDAKKAAERVRAAIESLELTTKSVNGGALKVTASVGVCMADMVETPQALYELADQALYRSKNGGRNAVTVAGTLNTSSSERYQIYKK